MESQVKFTSTSLLMFPMNVATLHTWFALALIYMPAPKPPADPRFATTIRAEPTA